jgi:hypothetical protein
MRVATMVRPPVPLFDLLELLPLFVGKIDRDFRMRFRHDLVHAPASVAPNLPKLCSGFIDNWRNLCDLFRCQTQLRVKPLFHSLAHSSRTVILEEKMPSVKPAQSSASNSTGDKYKDKSKDKFPF